ncbi:hypothetical protein [Halarcobacter sp.]|uniref:hypothetical protein n=1 Tax=Halarcobacter sp. TaxID=2321133 RepID=UPI003B009B22
MKLYKVYIILFLFLSTLSGAEDKLEFFFDAKYNFSGPCEPTCRLVSEPEKFITKATDFDAVTGITTCDVFPKASGDNQLTKLSINANTQNQTCIDEFKVYKINYEDESLASVHFSKEKQSYNITEYNKNRITMSKFIGGLATLDDDIIHITESRNGTIQKRDPNSIYQLDSGSTGSEDRLLNTIDQLSSKNLSYYIDFFYSMDKVYEYMVAYVFVFISLFFMLLYSSKIALKKIAKKTTAFDEPWQSKIAVIVFTTVIFFVPMKLDNEYSSTLFQNIWKYFVEESTSIADRANTIGMQTYMQKVYNTTGASGVETEANLKLTKTQQAHLKETYKKALDICKERYQNTLTFQQTSLNQIKNIEESKGTYDDILTLRGCRAIEKRYKIAFTMEEQADMTLKRINAAYNDSSEIKDRLNTMTEHLDKRLKELGWYSSVLAPTLQVLTKISFLQGAEKLPDTTNNQYRAYINAASDEKIGNIEQESKSGRTLREFLDINVKASESDETKKNLGEIFSKTSFISLIPGASTLTNFFKDLGTENINALLKELPLDKNSVLLANLSKETKNLVYSTTIVKFILELLPFITTFIAVGIVIILYIYELIVFSFISPFIVAFSVTTGQARKILDFLVTALTLFLKPTIIVIAIYLSLFLYSIFQDIFVLMADEQFYLSRSSASDFMPSLIFHFVREMLFIFAVFASVYFMWKLIMEMPDFIFKKIGLENLTSGTQMASSMQQSFGKFGFRA